MKKMAPRMAEVLPKHMDMNRMSRIALTTIRTNPKLECAVPSLMGAVMQAVQLGLEPGLLGHCYILPYKREATFIIGYKGMIDLARRSGHIQSIYAHAVHENDEFEYELGLHPKLEHKPSHRGAFIGAHAVAHFKDGGYQMEFMPKSEIEKRRKRSAPLILAIALGVATMKKWRRKLWFVTCLNTYRLVLKCRHKREDEVVRKDITEEPEFIEVELEEPEELSVEQKEIISENNRGDYMA